jgi:hypothetical protein
MDEVDEDLVVMKDSTLSLSSYSQLSRFILHRRFRCFVDPKLIPYGVRLGNLGSESGRRMGLDFIS